MMEFHWKKKQRVTFVLGVVFQEKEKFSLVASALSPPKNFVYVERNSGWNKFVDTFKETAVAHLLRFFKGWETLLEEKQKKI